MNEEEKKKLEEEEEKKRIDEKASLLEVMNNIIKNISIKEKKELFSDKTGKFSTHRLRFKQKLIQKPSWLLVNEDISWARIRRFEMSNWVKYVIYLPYPQLFGGIDNIEVCNNVVIYNFQRLRDNCIVLVNFFEARRADCQKLRSFLETNGFEIDPKEPELIDYNQKIGIF